MNDNGQLISDLIKEFYRLHKRENSLDEIKLLNSWRTVVGNFISDHTLDVSIKKNIMYVKVDADSLSSELMFSKSLLIKNLNKVVGYDLIKDIIIR